MATSVSPQAAAVRECAWRPGQRRGKEVGGSGGGTWGRWFLPLSERGRRGPFARGPVGVGSFKRSCPRNTTEAEVQPRGGPSEADHAEEKISPP